MEKSSERKAVSKTSLNTILCNWTATLFAYHPEVYFQLDHYRRNLHQGFVTPVELHDCLLNNGLLSISPDESNLRKLYLRLDSDMFPRARGKLWTVTVKRNGSELEFSCVDDPEAHIRGCIH